MKDEVVFLAPCKRQRFFQIDTVILGVWPVMPKLAKVTILLFFLQYLKKEVSEEVDFFACR